MVVLKNICMGLAYIVFHMHQAWPTLIQDLISQLSNSIQEATCLLIVIRYIASECENENVVIEESLRESFFQFIDTQTQVVFKDVFDKWALQLMNMDKKQHEVRTLKKDIMSAFYEWIKLKLPKEVLVMLSDVSPNLLQMIF
jgi:hypothetical protein